MKQLIVVLGPTAVGKTACAIRLAQTFQTEILSFDSRQFYRELDIGVARPSPDELAAATHHFIANRSVLQPYNVYDYEHEALDLLQQLFQHHDVAIAVGGSGLYADALCNGINRMPDPTPELRASLAARIAEGQLDQLLDELRQLDPDYYAVVDRRNPIRIQRALEVIYTSGHTFSSHLHQPLPERPFAITKVALRADPPILRERIDRRVDLMMEQGLMDEVRALLPLRHLNTLNTVGYKELFAHLDGQSTLPDAVKAIKHNTWRYAKKQTTWLKRYPEIFWTEKENFSQLLQFLREKLY